MSSENKKQEITVARCWLEQRVLSSLPGFGKTPLTLWTTDARLLLTSIDGGFPAASSPKTEEYLGATLDWLFPNAAPNSPIVEAHERALRGDSSTIRVEIIGGTLHMRIEPLRNDAGDIIGVVGTAHDDTEHLVAERALKLSAESYRGLIERAPFAICQSTVSGQLLQVNRAMVEMLGYDSEADVLLQSLRSDISMTPLRFDEFFSEVGAKSLCQGFECQWRRQDGGLIDVNIAGRALRDSYGEITVLEILAENVTEKKQLETQLRQGQKIQAIGQLAAGIAHDFNNLLSIISGETEMLLSEADAGHPFIRRFRAIEDATDRAGKLTRQLLAFTRMQMLQSRVVDLNAVIARMHSMLVRLLGDMIHVEFKPSADLGRIKVDPSQLEQVVMNLAVNARDAMPGGGRLTIETYNIRVQENAGRSAAEPPGEYVALAVRDTGHGIDPATQTRIFDPFFTTKPMGQGTGLGLSVVYSVVKQCGGFVEVESELGKGTVFTLYFLTVPEPEEEAPTTPKDFPQATGAETILLAEDDNVSRRIFREYLQSIGYRVLEACDDESALRLADMHGKEINVLVTDLMMPKAGGYQLAEKLQKTFPQLKVILMSGQFEDFGANPEANSWPFLQKPFRLKTLAARVREVLND